MTLANRLAVCLRRPGSAVLRAGPALVLCVFLAACGPLSREAAWLLDDIAAGAGPSRLKDETPAPVPSAVRLAAGGIALDADLYLSPAGARAALVLVPGLARAGRADARLVALAQSLARVRFAVLVPEITGLSDLQVAPAQAGEIAAAAAWLAGRGDLARGRPVGVVAISYAAGPALIAAASPAGRADIGFVVTVGGYYDIESAVTYVTTGAYYASGRWRHGTPNAYGKWVFVNSNAHRLADSRERAALAAIAERKLDDPEAPIDDLARALRDDGRAVLALVTNDHRRRVAELIAALPEAIRADLAALDPAARPLEDMRARLILIHGRDDTIIPYSESVDLARRLGSARASLYLLDGLWHVDAAFSLGDRLTLWRAAVELLELRDGAER